MLCNWPNEVCALAPESHCSDYIHWDASADKHSAYFPRARGRECMQSYNGALFPSWKEEWLVALLAASPTFIKPREAPGQVRWAAGSRRRVARVEPLQERSGLSMDTLDTCKHWCLARTSGMQMSLWHKTAVPFPSSTFLILNVIILLHFKWIFSYSSSELCSRGSNQYHFQNKPDCCHETCDHLGHFSLGKSHSSHDSSHLLFVCLTGL